MPSKLQICLIFIIFIVIIRVFIRYVLLFIDKIALICISFIG